MTFFQVLLLNLIEDKNEPLEFSILYNKICLLNSHLAIFDIHFSVDDNDE